MQPRYGLLRLQRRWCSSAVVFANLAQHRRLLRPPDLRHQGHLSRRVKCGVIVSGSDYCHLTQNGACFTDGVGNHANNERCTVRTTQSLYATATYFQTEAYYDLLMSGTRYSGTAGPANVQLAAGATVLWRADRSVINGGFIICGSTSPVAAPPPPVVAPSPPITAGQMWVVVSGSNYCHLTQNGACFTDGVGNHANNERCTVRTTQALYATTTYFATESYYDHLTIGNTQYSGSNGPQNVAMAAGATVAWSTDYSITNGGFVLCGSTSPVAFPPPIASPPPSPVGCTNTCTHASDGDCDDGGPGAEYSACNPGTDCFDCSGGGVAPPSSSPGGSAPPSSSPAGCTNTCTHANDGDCDDGGPGAEYSACNPGTDCNDCSGGGTGRRLSADPSPGFAPYNAADFTCGATGPLPPPYAGPLPPSFAGPPSAVAPPPSTVASPPFPPNTIVGCLNTCNYAFDGDCDDGGSGSEYTQYCQLATDCHDCGPRVMTNRPPSQPGLAPPPVTAGGGGALIDTCFNDCRYASDNDCDDGGSGAEYTLCYLGHDCIDCGPRLAPEGSPPPPPPSPSPPPPTGASPRIESPAPMPPPPMPRPEAAGHGATPTLRISRGSPPRRRQAFRGTASPLPPTQTRRASRWASP